jgi:hypothetical protein
MGATVSLFGRNTAIPFIDSESELESATWIAKRLKDACSAEDFTRCRQIVDHSLKSHAQFVSAVGQEAVPDVLADLEDLVALCIDRDSSPDYFARIKREYATRDNMRMFGAAVVQSQIDEYQLMRTARGRKVATGWYLRAQKLRGTRSVLAAVLTEQLV